MKSLLQAEAESLLPGGGKTSFSQSGESGKLPHTSDRDTPRLNPCSSSHEDEYSAALQEEEEEGLPENKSETTSLGKCATLSS